MTSVHSERRVAYEFGPYRIDLDTYGLYRNGEPVPVPPKAFELLLILVEHRGRMIRRDELIRKLWPDTIVEDGNLTVHISALRKIFGDNPDASQYIQTSARRGYRFVPEVRELDGHPPAAPAGSGPPVQAGAGGGGWAARTAIDQVFHLQDWSLRHRLMMVMLPIWLLVIALICILVLVSYNFSEGAFSNGSDLASWTIVPLTTDSGRETRAAFSPDGNRIAFVRHGEKDGNADLYVRQLIDGSQPMRLTANHGDDVDPVWSPDGQWLAFYRRAVEGDGVFIMPSVGGAERQLISTWSNRFDFDSHTWLHWSPNGVWLAVSDKNSEEEPFSLFLVSPETGEKRRLTSPPASVVGDCSPAFAPDGKSVAFVRAGAAGVGDLYLISIDGRELKRITFAGQNIGSLTWAPDGRELVYSVRQGEGGRLFRIRIRDGNPQWIEACGNEALYPAFSSLNHQLAWTQCTVDTDIHRIEISGHSEMTGRDLSSGLIVSTKEEVSPEYSPDGRRIVFVSTRSGNPEIWICGSEGEDPLRLTSFRGPLVGSPRWSPDNKQLVFDGRLDGNAEIFVISSEGGQPRRLTHDPAEDIVPNWSHDGRWIYFTSNRTGRLQIWKLPVSGGEAVQVTTEGGFESTESADGRSIYYTQDRGLSAIWQAPVAGGREQPLYDFGQKDYSRMWTIRPEGIYFAIPGPGSGSIVRRFNPALGQATTVAVVDGSLPSSVSGLAISPDGKYLLFPRVIKRDGDLMMIEKFR
ncbi:MAG TPA: winged helix-turn-helix domain-containing protein [Blastocatellia bacterium]|nr:winged helix-turn-helix domain-containing protein [Blastocatellia bacterium]